MRDRWPSFLAWGVLVVVAPVVAVGCGGTAPGPSGAGSSITMTSPTVSTRVVSTGGQGRSQSAADAQRDRVLPQVASLPLAQRLAPVEGYSGRPVEAATPDGIWVISRPDLAAVQGAGGAGGGCWGPDTQAGIGYRACPGYSEALLLSRDRSRIVRAFPMPFPAYWMLADSAGVYFGRAGDGGLPDSHVCRIDTRAWSLTCRVDVNTTAVDPYLADSKAFAALALWPGTWTAYPPGVTVAMYAARLTDTALVLSDAQGHHPTRLDLQTLLPVGAHTGSG